MFFMYIYMYHRFIFRSILTRIVTEDLGRTIILFKQIKKKNSYYAGP